MIKSVTRTSCVLIAIAFSATGLMAQSKSPAPAATIAGKWTLQADTPHGKMTMGLELKFDEKDAKKVTGTLSNDMMGNLPLAGQYVEAKLTFKAEGGPGELLFAGKLKDANTLTGVLSSPNGDVAIVATRVVEK